MNTGYTVLVCSRPSTRMSGQPFVWHDIVITLHSLAEVYHILVTLTPQRPLQEVLLLPVDHPSHQVFITCQGHRGETCRLNQPGEKLYKYLNIAIKTFLGFSMKCPSSPTNSLKLCTYQCNAGGEGGGEAGHRVGIWLFSKICNQIPCTRANHSSQMQPNFPTPGCTLLSIPRQNLREAQ